MTDVNGFQTRFIGLGLSLYQCERTMLKLNDIVVEMRVGII